MNRIFPEFHKTYLATYKKPSQFYMPSNQNLDIFVQNWDATEKRSVVLAVEPIFFIQDENYGWPGLVFFIVSYA